MIENYINCIDAGYTTFDGEPAYLYRGDGQGDFEKINSKIKSVKLLDDYQEWLETQMEYVKVMREKETQI